MFLRHPSERSRSLMLIMSEVRLTPPQQLLQLNQPVAVVHICASSFQLKTDECN